MLVAGLVINYNHTVVTTKCVVINTALQIVEKISFSQSLIRLTSKNRAECYKHTISKLTVLPDIIMIMDYGWYYTDNRGAGVILQELINIPVIAISRRFIPCCGVVPNIMTDVFKKSNNIYCFGNNTILGAVIPTFEKTKTVKPIIISCGYRASQETLIDIANLVLLFTQSGKVLPEPIRLAGNL